MADRGSESGSPVIGCPVPGPNRLMSNQDWWPDQPDLRVLRQPSPRSSPVGENSSYAQEFRTLDVEALRRDVVTVMTESQDWWPADFGHYGPLFIRMA